MRVRAMSVRGLPDQTYLELVRSLFTTLAPTTIMGVLFIVVATMATRRIGGDEFVVLQTGLNHPDEVDLMARRIVRALCKPYDIDGHQVVIGASLGYALPDGRDNDLARLLGGADRALYGIKRDGGSAAAQAGSQGGVAALPG